MPSKSHLISVAKALALAYLLALAVAAMGQRWLIYPVWAAAAMASDYVPPGTRVVSVATADRETLKGFWKRPASAGGPIVVTFHGNASNPAPHAERFTGGPWLANGWGTLAIAYRGYPGSTGSPTEDGLLKDAQAALDFVRREAPGSPVLLHGHSLGAAVAIAASRGSETLGLYLEAPFLSMLDMARARAWFLPVTWLVSDTFRSDLRIVGFAGPVMVVHGTDDPVIPVGQGQALARIPVGGRFVPIEGADHVSLFGARDVEAEALFRPR